MTDRTAASLRTALVPLAAAGFAVAAGAHVWARHIEINLFTVREVDLPVLPAGAEDIRVLHMSDAHLLPEQYRKRAFLRSLDSLNPDLIINTGDNVASEAGIGAVLADIAPLLYRPGVFVLGSNDKFAAGRRNIFRYLLRDARPADYRERFKKAELPVGRLVKGLASGGWKDLSNTRAEIEVKGTRLDFVGVDDPHLDHDVFPAPSASPGEETAQTSPLTLRIGVTHAPYARVLDQFVDDGCDIIFAGHTHGGQLALPFYGALVTNCDLHRSQAKGVSFHRGVPLHVSGGLGASPYYNMRMANRPEVTVLTLRARDSRR